MGNRLETAMDEAIAWHLGLEQAGSDDWHRFVRWLEADPAHAEAYDRLTMESAALLPARIAPLAAAPADRKAPRTGTWRRWAGVGGGFAAAAAAAWLTFVPAVAPDSYAIETQPGMRRTVALADGTQIDLNGATRLVLDRNRPRIASLERGEAIFHVAHKPGQPFEVRSGGILLRDVGTVFNVVRSGAALRVAVAEGAILYQPEHEALALSRGMALAMRDGDDRLTLSHVEARTVGGWSDGHLDFREVALTTVAEDVRRSTGARLSIAPALARRLFTGTLRLDRPPEDVIRSLAELTGGEAYRDGPSWVIGPRTGGAR